MRLIEELEGEKEAVEDRYGLEGRAICGFSIGKARQIQKKRIAYGRAGYYFITYDAKDGDGRDVWFTLVDVSGMPMLFLRQDFEEVERDIKARVMDKLLGYDFGYPAKLNRALENPLIVKVFKAGRFSLPCSCLRADEDSLVSEDGDGGSLAVDVAPSSEEFAYAVTEPAYDGILAPMGLKEALELFSRLASGLSEMQPMVFHGQLCPQNVVGSKEKPKLINFYSGKDYSEKGMGMTLATMPDGRHDFDRMIYYAPEMIKSREKDYGPKSDVYSMGMLLYFALTGNHPFHVSSIREFLQLVKGEPGIQFSDDGLWDRKGYTNARNLIRAATTPVGERALTMEDFAGVVDGLLKAVK